MKTATYLLLIVSMTLGLGYKQEYKPLSAIADGYVDLGKSPLCPIKDCSYFSSWSEQGITACYKHSIDDYREGDSVLLVPYKKEMTFGY